MLGSIPVAGNFDPSDDAYEVAEVYPDSASRTLHWAIRRGRGVTLEVPKSY